MTNENAIEEMVNAFCYYIENASMCEICERSCIKNDLYGDILGQQIHTNDRIYVGSLHEHHLSYLRDETMLICAECHSKIHSKVKGFLKYYPVDQKTFPFFRDKK